MNIQHITRRLAVLGFAGVMGAGLAGCDSLLTESPPNILTADNLYRTPAGFEAGLNGLYDLVRQENYGMNGGGSNELPSLFWTVGVDNAFGGTNDNIARLVTDLGTRLHPASGELATMWARLYRKINSANTIIGRAANPELKWTETERDQVIAEARLIRALQYRHLTYLWGDVPLTLEESSGDEIRTDWVRTPVAEVRKQMEADMLFAVEHLSDTPRDGRVSKAVARHYLAELYLAMDEPAKAEEEAEAVINSGLYHLVTERYGVKATEPGTPFTDMFLDGNVLRSQGNTEVLWTHEFEQNVPGGREQFLRRTWMPTYFNIPGITFGGDNSGRGQSRAFPTRWAVELYSPGDDRGSKFALRKYYIYNNPANLPEGVSLGDTLWLQVKDNTRTDFTQISTRKWDCYDPQRPTEAASWCDVGYLRLGETYLVLAEAQFRQGHAGDAAETINALRRRAHAPEIDASDVTLDFILDERSRELLAEEQRRYTLVRTGTFAERVRKYNQLVGPLFEDKHVYLPIPQSVIDANLTGDFPQNPGW
jgi:hypothetical protein